MTSHVLNRVREINEHMGSLLDELGVYPKILRYPDAIYIEFLSRDGNTMSPVEIQLGRSAKTTSTVSSWKGSEMSAASWQNVEVGDNGWIYQEFLNTSSRLEMTANRDAGLDELAKWLRVHGVVHINESREKYFTNRSFAAAYHMIRGALPSDQEVTINCDRDAGGDSFVFSCPKGHNWRVSLRGLDVVLAIDGHEELVVKTHELQKIGTAIYQRLEGFRLNTRLDP